MHYVNQKLNTILETSRVELNRDKLKKIYDEAQRIIYDDKPVIPLWYEKNFVMTRKNIKGYQLFPNASFNGLVTAYKEN